MSPPVWTVRQLWSWGQPRWGWGLTCRAQVPSLGNTCLSLDRRPEPLRGQAGLLPPRIPAANPTPCQDGGAPVP